MTPRVNLNESLVSGFFLFRINGTFSMLLIFAPPQSMCLFFLYHICHSNSPLPSKAQNMDSLLIENAKSNRSRCGVCKETIQEGEERVGTQRFHPFKGFPCTTWHHRTCFDCPWHGNQDDVKIVDVSQESFKAFVQAARLVVSPSVQKFRNKSMQEHSFCPITGKSLDASNSHVHHFGPFDFSRIVKSFLRKYRVALHRVSFTAGQFSNESLANSFAAYHERKKRYLMVHQDANLSILKKRKRLGPCDVCFSCRHLTWVFNEGVCKNCRSSPQHRRKYMSARQCRYWYGFTTNNLAGEECQRMTNPISANFAPMRLYKRERIEKLAIEKFGSLEKAHQIKESKRIQRRGVRQRNYKAARAFHMNLRARRSTSIAHDHEEEFATPAQLRYLLDLGAESIAGISKNFASEVISTMVGEKKGR